MEKAVNKKIIIIIIAIVIVLAVTLGVTAYFNILDIKEKKIQQENSVIVIKSGDKELAEVSMDFMIGLGEKEFKANLKKSGQSPSEHSFTGIPLKNLFDGLQIDITKVTSVVLKAIDGYTSALTMDEVMEEDNVYIVYKIDGAALGDSKNGGYGPYMAVVRADPYSQRWCKFLTEIELQ